LKDYFYTETGASSFDKFSEDSSRGSVLLTKDARNEDFKENFKQEISGEKMASLDLVLVASRHLFRMPYSLHEKTGMASVVLTKEEVEKFNPKMADPLTAKVEDFVPECDPEEGKELLERAIAWKKVKDEMEGVAEKNKYSDYKPVDMKGVTEDMFPMPIKKLLKGVGDGKKRGLFILLTFLKSTGFEGEKIVEIVQEWNKRNEQPLKEGYVRSQISWHMKQKKQILPPNYSNDNFYKDLGLLDKEPKTKNPVVDVSRELRKRG
jgi:DNA primase large subunit